MLNLHNIVRGAINANLADETFTLFRSCGQQNIKGIVKAIYLNGIEVKGSFQSENDAALDHSNLAGQNSQIRKLYLQSSDKLKEKPYSVFRQLSRSGDYLKDSNSMWWFVIAVEEDFSKAGWMCLRVQLQDKAPNLTIKAIELTPSIPVTPSEDKDNEHDQDIDQSTGNTL